MKIDWSARITNPWWWAGLIGVIFSPVLASMGISQVDLATWNSVLDVLKTFINTPYLVFSAVGAVLGFVGITNNPTTKGLSDEPTYLR